MGKSKKTARPERESNEDRIQRIKDKISEHKKEMKKHRASLVEQHETITAEALKPSPGGKKRRK